MASFPSSCENIWRLPDDVMVDILCRLPHHVLCRFKTVCRSWNYLISNACVALISSNAANDNFGLLVGLEQSPRNHKNTCRDHSLCDGLIRSSSYACYKCSQDHSSLTKCEFSVNFCFFKSISQLVPFDYKPRDLVHCCNGLILFRTDSMAKYYVCNPMTKQCIAIPMLNGPARPSYESLAFNPSESLHYRIFCIPDQCSDHMLGTIELYIFSSETGQWERCQMNIKTAHNVCDEKRMKRVVYLNGVLYQLSYSKFLIIYDLKATVVSTIELPLKEETAAGGFIGVSKGDLHYGNHDKSRTLLWVLKNDGNGHFHWDLKDCLSFSDLRTRGCGVLLCGFQKRDLFNPYAIHPTSDVVFLGTQCRIASYNLQTKEVITVMSWSFDFVSDGVDTVFPYSRSLVVLKEFTA